MEKIMTIVWQDGSNNPDNATHLDTIRQWWASLQDQEIHWQQRLLPTDGDLSGLDWQPQRFDETFGINNPEIRGITVYFKHLYVQRLLRSKLKSVFDKEFAQR
jgi:hypothetical protein